MSIRRVPLASDPQVPDGMWRRRRARKPEHSTVFIGDGSAIDGCCRFTGVAVVAGRVTGDLIAADHLMVAETGTVTGVVQATVVTVSGTIFGTVRATERVALLASARITGDIETPALSIDAGAVLDGRCQTSRAAPAQPEIAAMSQTG
jgi:cytoskeletal protein CcmA (bactofilin family)